MLPWLDKLVETASLPEYPLLKAWHLCFLGQFPRARLAPSTAVQFGDRKQTSTRSTRGKQNGSPRQVAVQQGQSFSLAHQFCPATTTLPWQEALPCGEYTALNAKGPERGIQPRQGWVCGVGGSVSDSTVFSPSPEAAAAPSPHPMQCWAPDWGEQGALCQGHGEMNTARGRAEGTHRY